MNALQHNSNLEITTLDQKGSDLFWQFLSGTNSAPSEIPSADSVESDEQFESRAIFRAVWRVAGRNKVKTSANFPSLLFPSFPYLPFSSFLFLSFPSLPYLPFSSFTLPYLSFPSISFPSLLFHSLSFLPFPSCPFPFFIHLLLRICSWRRSARIVARS